MIKKDSLIVGIVVGTLVPFVGYALILSLTDILQKYHYTLKIPQDFEFHEKTNFMLAIAFIIIPIELFRRKKLDESLRGVVFPLIIYICLWGYFFGAEILSNF